MNSYSETNLSGMEEVTTGGGITSGNQDDFKQVLFIRNAM